MKETTFIKRAKREKRKYQVAKIQSYLRMKCSFGEKRKINEFRHSIFRDRNLFVDIDNSLPEGFYYAPTDIVIYDLIPKTNLKLLKKGIINLYRKCFTHKYLHGGRSEDDIDNLINGLNRTLHNGNSWYNIGLFDYASNNLLDSYIKHFELRVHNFSSSYAAVEMRVVLSEIFHNEMEKYIKENCRRTDREIHRHWISNGRKSGAKIGLGVSYGFSSDYAKCCTMLEQLEYVKNLFLNELKKYLPLMLYSKSKDTIGIYVFETNISPKDSFDKNIYRSLGLNDRYGFYFSPAERLYAEIDKNMSGENSNDMIYVYNPELISDYAAYHTPNNKTLHYFADDYMSELYRIVIIKNIGMVYQNLITHYRNESNRINTTRFALRKLLKIRSSFNVVFYDFKKIDEELPVGKTITELVDELDRNDYSRKSMYMGLRTSKYFTYSPGDIWEQVKSNMVEIDSDLQRKIEISSGLTEYSREASNRRLGYYQLLLAILTFAFLLFPSKAEYVAELIKQLLQFLSKVFT